LSNPEIRLKLADRGLKVSQPTISRAINNYEASDVPIEKKDIENNTLYSPHDDIFPNFRYSDKSVNKREYD